MHTHGHSAGGGRHSAGRQQYRVRNTAEEQQGRHVLPIDANTKMHAELRAVTGLDSSDQLPARHRFAR